MQLNTLDHPQTCANRLRSAARAGREIWVQEARNIQGYPWIYHVYTSNDIPWISMDIPCIYLVNIHGISLDIHGISTLLDMYGISKDIPYIYHTYTIHIYQDTICMVYTIHIPGIYQKSGFQMQVEASGLHLESYPPGINMYIHV